MSQRNLQRVVYSRAKRQPDLKDPYAEGEGTSNTIDRSKMPKFSKPKMDKNTCSGGDEDSDSELSLTACHNRFSLLQSSPSPPSSTTRKSSTAKKRRKRRNRSDKLQSSSPASSMPGPFTRGNSSEELLESPTPQSVKDDQPEPELSSSDPEPDDVPKVQPVGEMSSSPGFVQPEAPVERLEAQPTPPAIEPELPLPASHSSTGRECRKRRKRSDKLQSSSPASSMPGPFTRGNSSEELLESPTPQSVKDDQPEPELSSSDPESDDVPKVQPVGEISSSPGFVQPEAPVERPEAQPTPPAIEPELPLPASHSSTGRECRKRRKRRKRSDKLQSSSLASSMPGPFIRGNSSEELLESPTPQSVKDDQPEPELSSSDPEPDDVPKVQPVGEMSSSPGFVQPEAPVERPEAQPTPPAIEPELPLPASHSSTGRERRKRRKRSDKLQSSSPASSMPGPFTRGNSSEELLESPTPQSVKDDQPEPELSSSDPESDDVPKVQPVGEISSSPGFVQPEAPVERPEAQPTPPAIEPELPLPASHSSTGRECRKRRKRRKRSDKLQSSSLASSMPGPFTRGNSSEELLESPTPQSVKDDQPEPELSSSDPEPDDVPKVQPVGEMSSSPGFVQPEAPVERPEAQPTPPAIEPELPLPASHSSTGRERRKRRKRSDKLQSSSPASSMPGPFTRGNSSEELLESPTPQSVKDDQPEPELSSSDPESDDAPRLPVGERSQKLPCLQSDASSSEATLSEGSWSPRELRHQMLRLLLEDMASDEDIFNCVKEKLERTQKSSSPYLRELMTAVCKAAVKENTNCRVHAALLQKRVPVTLEYRYSEREQQMQALRELQALIVALDQPPDLLRIFFHCMYDKDVSSKGTFCKSGTSNDLADQLGNGVALKTVTVFFTWLREAESQDD